MTDFHYIDLSRDDDVLVVTIDKPDDPMNTVDAELHHDLSRLFGYLRLEREARVILLTGSGKAFSAGGDFDWFPNLRSAETLHELRLDAKAIVWDLLDVHLPLVCALNGSAAGLGTSVALLCDIIVMADDAIIADPHVKVGIVAGDGGTIVRPLAVGPALAKQYLLTGDPVRADAALRMGLVNVVVPRDEVRDAGLAWARRLASGAPMAVQYTKAAINSWIKATMGPHFDLATVLELTTFRSADHDEALHALAERREPRFEGR